MPDNCKNFVETFSLFRKGRHHNELGSSPCPKAPPGPHVLEVAQSLQEMLDAGVVNSRADLARRLGVSRARVTQLLSLLKLPAPIVQFLTRCRDPIVLCHFSERRLRPLAKLPSDAEGLAAFRKMLEHL